MEKLRSSINAPDIWCRNCGKRLDYSLLHATEKILDAVFGKKSHKHSWLSIAEMAECCESPDYTVWGLNSEDYMDIEEHYYVSELPSVEEI
jgi:hypothetical protein